MRQMSLRSKSQASYHDQASPRVTGMRRPRGASPSSVGAAEPSGTRDSATQTIKARTSPAADELSPTRDLEGAPGERRSEFLFGPIQLQSELGMAIQAALEFTAERRINHSYSPSEFAAIRGLGGEDGSDDEAGVDPDRRPAQSEVSFYDDSTPSTQVLLLVPDFRKTCESRTKIGHS